MLGPEKSTNNSTLCIGTMVKSIAGYKRILTVCYKADRWENKLAIFWDALGFSSLIILSKCIALQIKRLKMEGCQQDEKPYGETETGKVRALLTGYIFFYKTPGL